MDYLAREKDRMTTRRAAVRISLEAVGKLLHLRDGLTLTSAQFDPGTQAVAFFLAGDTLPEHCPREQTQILSLASVMNWELS